MWHLIWVWLPGDKTRQQEKTSGGGTVALVDAVVFAWKAAKAVWWLASNFAVGLAVLAVALYGATRWTVRAIHRGYRWYVNQPVIRGRRPPIAAITDKPADKATAMTLADLELKEPANS